MRRRWTESEKMYMRENFANTPTKVIAKRLDRSYESVCGMAYLMQLNKCEEYFVTNGGGRLQKGSTIGISGRFVKGCVPHNKGKKMDSELKERIQHTFFKPGSLPHNTKYDGHESIRVSKGRKYVWIRVNGKYVLKHRHIWETHCGPIPKGCNVQFSDGNSMNLKPENLYLITRDRQMLVNSIHNYPEDIVELMRLKGKLKKLIKTKRHGKEQN